MKILIGIGTLALTAVVVMGVVEVGARADDSGEPQWVTCPAGGPASAGHIDSIRASGTKGTVVVNGTINPCASPTTGDVFALTVFHPAVGYRTTAPYPAGGGHFQATIEYRGGQAICLGTRETGHAATSDRTDCVQVSPVNYVLGLPPAIEGRITTADPILEVKLKPYPLVKSPPETTEFPQPGCPTCGW
jgi:hypothetical protein